MQMPPTSKQPATLSLDPTLTTPYIRYLDDLPALEGELYAGLVFSEHAHAKITVDASAALAIEGVVDYVCVDDVPGSNMIGEYRNTNEHGEIVLRLSST